MSEHNLAKLINHQLQVIDKLHELARLHEKVGICKSELRELVQKSKEQILSEIKTQEESLSLNVATAASGNDSRVITKY